MTLDSVASLILRSSKVVTEAIGFVFRVQCTTFATASSTHFYSALASSILHITTVGYVQRGSYIDLRASDHDNNDCCRAAVVVLLSLSTGR